MAKILRLFRSDNLKANFEDAKSALLAHEGKRADGEQIICRYMDTDGKVKSAIGIYATGQNNVGVTVIKCSDEIDKDINRVLDELDNTQKGAGLNEDGSYTAPDGDDILGDAISLFDADQKLADAIRKEIQDRIDAINALDYEDTEVEGQVVVSVSEQDGIVSNQKKKIKDIVLTDYQGKGEEGSLNISTETIGDAFGSIETYIKNLDVAPISAEGYAIVQVSEENGRISAETGTINAETVNIKDFNDIIDADNVEDALQEMKKQIDQVKLTSDDASVTITKPNDHKQPTDLGVNIKTGERLIRKDGNSGIYTNLTLEKLTSGLAANIREQYQVKDSYGIMIGEPINIYKDSALLSVALLHSTNSYKPTYNKNNGSWTDISDTNEVNLSLCFAYEDVNGDVQIIAIPVGNFLRESEFKDGLTVNVNGEVFVLIDPMSGKVVTKDGQVDVLTVSPTGVKVSNIQEAIDFLNENLTKALNDEIERAKDAEKALKDALDQEIQDRKDGDKNLEDALNAEIQRAKDAEETNKDNLADEIARAKKREDEIEASLNSEIERAKKAESDTLDSAKSYTDQKVTEEKNRAELAEQGLAHDIDNEKSRAELAEQGLSSDISTERQRAIGEESRLEALIKQEEQRAEKAEAANLEAAKSYTDTKVTEERNRAMAAESANLETAKTYTDTKFGEEKARAEKAESELKSAIDLEQQRAIAKEDLLKKEIDDEYKRAKAAEDAIDKKLSDEISRATNKETELSSAIETETTRAKSEEKRIEDKIDNVKGSVTSLETKLTTEISERKQADSDLDKKISDTENRLIDRNNELNSKILESNQRITNIESQTTIINGNETTPGSIANAIRQSKDYTDDKLLTIELRSNGGSNLMYDLYVNGRNAGSINIPKESILDNVSYDPVTRQLTFTFDNGKAPVTINISDLIDDYTAGDGLRLDTNKFSVVISGDTETQKYMAVGPGGISLKGITEAINTAVDNEKRAREAADGNLDSKIFSLSQTTSSTDAQILAQLAVLKANSEQGDIDLDALIQALTQRVDNLNSTDSESAGQFVTSVSQSGGLISRTKARVQAQYVDTTDGSNVQTEINNIKSRLTTTEGTAGSALQSVTTTGSGDAIVSVSQSGTGLTFTKGYVKHHEIGSDSNSDGTVITKAEVDSTTGKLTLHKGKLSYSQLSGTLPTNWSFSTRNSGNALVDVNIGSNSVEFVKGTIMTGGGDGKTYTAGDESVDVNNSYDTIKVNLSTAGPLGVYSDGLYVKIDNNTIKMDNTTKKLYVASGSGPGPDGPSTYSGGNGINISESNAINVNVDDSTIKVNASNQLYAVSANSRTFAAGPGLDVDNAGNTTTYKVKLKSGENILNVSNDGLSINTSALNNAITHPNEGGGTTYQGGHGIEVSGNTIMVKCNTGDSGLRFDSEYLRVNFSTSSGLTSDNTGLKVKLSSNYGLTCDNEGLKVRVNTSTGAGLVCDTDGIRIKTSTNNGLSFNYDGSLKVHLSPDSGNILELRSGGLYAAATGSGGPTTEDVIDCGVW